MGKGELVDVVKLCRCCGREIMTESANTMYCADCAKARKKQADAEAWQRRKLRNERKNRMISVFEKEHAEMLGIDYRIYYPSWRNTHVKAWRQYIKRRMEIWEAQQKSKLETCKKDEKTRKKTCE